MFSKLSESHASSRLPGLKLYQAFFQINTFPPVSLRHVFTGAVLTVPRSAHPFSHTISNEVYSLTSHQQRTRSTQQGSGLIQSVLVGEIMLMADCNSQAQG